MRHQRLIGLSVAGTVVLACVAVAWVLTPGPRRTGLAQSSSAIAPPTAPSGAPAGPENARSAAVGFATDSQNWLYLTDAQIDQAVLRIATPGAGARLAAQTVADMSAARHGLSASYGPLWWLVRPLAAGVETFSPPDARVGVWVVTVLCAPGVASPQANWETVTVDLTWETNAGGWKVSGLTETAGPTPLTSNQEPASSSDAFEAALAGYQRIGSEGAL